MLGVTFIGRPLELADVQRFEKIFRILDKDGNGTLSAAEIDEFYDMHLDRALEETLDGVVHQTVPQTSVRYSGSESGEA